MLLLVFRCAISFHSCLFLCYIFSFLFLITFVCRNFSEQCYFYYVFVILFLYLLSGLRCDILHAYILLPFDNFNVYHSFSL